VAVDGAGNLYVDDQLNYTIRMVTPVGTNWVVTTIAGTAGVAGSTDGTNSAALFGNNGGATAYSAGNVYVADSGNDTIRKVTPVGTNWVVTTLAGKALNFGSKDGTNSAARFYWPVLSAVDSAGNVYVTDCGNNTIRKVTPVGTNSVVTTLAGKVRSSGSADGTGSVAQFYLINASGLFGGGVALDGAGNVYVADVFNDTIREGYRPVAISSSSTGFGFSGGLFGFAITGPAGQAVVVEASTDLENWTPLWTNTFMVGPLQFSDTNSGAYQNRFYRAQRQ
jgi:ribosomal protein S11